MPQGSGALHGRTACPFPTDKDQVPALSRSSRDQPLEALRGIASLSVVAWHLLLGFAPGLPGSLPNYDPAVSWIGTPWFGLVQGGAAVAFFFVLSGFVLTRYALQSGSTSSLTRGVLKRWPRLAGPVLLTCLASWLLWKSGLYVHEAAGHLTNSPWLIRFAYGQPGPVFIPSFWDAFTQGSYFAFFRGRLPDDFSYDSSLWTLRLEFLGSLVTFAVGLTMVPLQSAWARGYLLLLSIFLCLHLDTWLVAFPVGTGLAALSAAGKLPQLAWPVGLCGVLLSVLGAGYALPSRAGNWTTALLGQPLSPVLVHIACAALLLVAIGGTPLLRRMLSGPHALLLGRLSFPIYLLHVPVICSVGSASYLVVGGGRLGVGAAAASTLVVTLLLAELLARFDIWWTSRLDLWATRLLPKATPKRDISQN